MLTKMETKSPLMPLKSLQTKAIRQYCSKNCDTVTTGERDVKTFLNIHIRQAIFDYILREKVTVSAEFVVSLLDGGLYHFDLWQLSERNNFSVDDIIAILSTLADNSESLRSLTLGGSTWIYNNRVVRGPLRSVFERKLSKLVSLKMQQIATSDDLLAVFRSCHRLTRLDICQPSITDRDINRIESDLRLCDVRHTLRQLLLPSSVKSNALLKLLNIFPNIECLKCAPFEQLIELIDIRYGDNEELAKRAAKTLSSLKSLTITHPMSCDTIDRIVELCPNLEEVSVEVQDGMQLSPIACLANLKRLEFRNSPSLPSSYLQQVLPILQIKGKSLESLSLEQFDVIDLTTYARLCPNLLSFSAQWFTILGFNNSQHSLSSKPFCNLNYLRLRPRSQRNVPSDACAFILTHAKNLIHIELYCCYDLSDADVQELHVRNSLTHLRSLILRHGHNVTKEALNILVSRAADLTFVDCGTPPLKKGNQANDDLPPD